MNEGAPDPNGRDVANNSNGGTVARPILAVVVATAVLYFSKDILVPVAMASVLAVTLSPIANRLETVVGTFVSAFSVVLAALIAIAAIGYFLTVELTGVAAEVSGYSDNIATKLNALGKNTPLWLQRVEHGVADVQQQLQKSNSRTKRRKTPVVETQPSSPDLSYVLKPLVPLVTAIGQGLLIIVLLFFLLYSRRDLRDRFIRLAARGRIAVAAQAIETAGDTVGHYLFLFSLTNFSFGVATGTIVWLLGLPHPEFWGGLGFLLRFIPYVGALTAAILPTMVAFAVFPGWSKPVEVLATFVVLDQAAAQFVEPFLIGRGIGVSPVAVLFSAMYWTWVWGPAGLLLATPLTACLKVAGDYIPALGFLSVLLGDDRSSEDGNEYYRRLLELDHAGAHGVAARYSDEHGLEPTFNDIIRPALIRIDEAGDQDEISQEHQQFVVETSREIITELGNRLSGTCVVPRLRLLGICPPSEVHSLGLLMLLELVRQEGAATGFAGEGKSAEEIRDFARRFAPDVVCLSCTVMNSLEAAAQLIRNLMADLPQLMIIAGGRAAIAAAPTLLAAGCSRVCRSSSEGRRVIKRYR